MMIGKELLFATQNTTNFQARILRKSEIRVIKIHVLRRSMVNTIKI